METRIQLTEEQVGKLFDFVKSKFVRSEDLKYELVDHLASSIEDLQIQYSEMTFDEGLQETYSRFPITGFTNFVAEKHKALHKYWLKKFINYYIQFFKVPKIILLAGLSYFIWTIFQYVPHSYLIILILITAIFYTIRDLKLAKKNNENIAKYSFLSIYYGITLSYNSILFSVLYGIPFSNFWNLVINPTATIVLSLFLALNILFNYAATYVFPIMLKEEIKNKYAHLNIKIAI